MSTAGTLDKYRVTVCFFLDHNSNKNTRILVPCQESWTINRLKEEAIRRLKKNLTPSYNETDGEGTRRQDEIVVKHIENLSKDILDGDDIIRDVLDNKEILVARLEGDEDVDFFNNDYLIRGSRTGSVTGDSIHSNMLPGGHVYPESIHLPLRAETEVGTPERHPPFYHHSYYSHDRRHASIQYPLHDDFMGEIHPPPPRSFASGYPYVPATDYEMPRIQPRYSYSRPDSCNSDVPHTSDSSNFMNAAQSRSPSVLSEENRVGQSAVPAPYHSHTLSNPENYPSDNTSPLIGITSGDSGYSNHSIPLPLYTHNIPVHVEATPSMSLPLGECPRPSPRNYSPSSEPTANTSPDNRDNEKVDSPSLSPLPVPFGRKYRPSVMHGYINPDPEPMQEMNPIKEASIVEEEPTTHEPLSKTSSNESKPSTPKVTLRLRTKARLSNKEPSLSTHRTDSPNSITLTTSGNDFTAPVDVPADCPMSTITGVQENNVPVEVSAERIVTPPLQLQSEQHIDKVIETAIELPEQRSMDVVPKVTKEARNHSYAKDSPALPQKRAKTSSSPPPATTTPPNLTLPIEVTPIPPAPKPDTPVLNHFTTPTNTQPEEQSPDISKPTSMVGGNRSIGAKFIVELEKGSGGLGFGIKSRDTAADGMTYPHFVSSIKPGGVAEADGRLKKGDLLLEVNGTDVTSMRHVLCLDYMRKQRGRIKLKISRQDKSRQAGDPDGPSYSEARIDDDKREEEATMDLVTPLVSEVLKEPPQEDETVVAETAREVIDTLEPSIRSIAASNTSLDELSPHQSRESLDEIGPKHERRRSSSIQNLLKQAALTDTTIFTPRGKKVQPLLIPLTEAGLGVSVRGKTRMNTNNKSQEGGGIYVKLIVPGGAADKDGRLKPNDQILSINGCVLVGQTNQEAMKTLKLGLDKIEQPVIKLVVLKKLPISSRSGKRSQRTQDNMYSRKLSLGSKNSTGYANSQLPSIYHPICMEDLQKNGEGKVFSVLDTHPDLDASRDKSSTSPPPDYESLTQGHIYEQLDPSKKRGKRSPSDVSKFRTAIQISTEEDEHIYARPQRRQTEEGIYTRANRVVYGRITASNKSQSVDAPMVRTPTYTEEIYAQPSMSKEEKSKKNRESIYESLLMVKPKYGEGVFKRKPREHLYECVTDIFDDPMNCREDNSDTANDLSALNRPASLAINNPYEISRSLDIGLSPSDSRNPALSTAAKSMSLQKTPSGGDTMQSMYPTGRSTPRGTRNVTSSRAVPHAPISSTKRPRSRTGRIQYPNPVDLSPYFTTVQHLAGKDRMPIPLTEPPVRSTLPDSGIYKTTIREGSQGPTPFSTPHRPVPQSPSTVTPLSPVDLTFASEQDDSLGPIEFRRDGQGRDDVSERHPFAKDAKQLNAYKDIQVKLAEEKLKSLQPASPAQTHTHPMSLDLDSGTNYHMQLGGSVSTPATDKQKEKLAASKKGSFFGRFKKKKTTKEKSLRDTPSPLLEAYAPSADDIDTYTEMMPPDDN